MTEPYQEAEARESKWDRMVAKCPCCSVCGCKILPGDRAFQHGEIIICDDCMEDYSGTFLLEEDF